MPHQRRLYDGPQTRKRPSHVRAWVISPSSTFCLGHDVSANCCRRIYTKILHFVVHGSTPFVARFLCSALEWMIRNSPAGCGISRLDPTEDCIQLRWAADYTHSEIYCSRSCASACTASACARLQRIDSGLLRSQLPLLFQ